MKAINDSFHEGKKSCGAEVEDDAIWIDKLNTMYDLSDIKTLTPSNKKPIMQLSAIILVVCRIEIFKITCVIINK